MFIFVIIVLVLGILVLSGLILLPVLLPVAATDDGVKITKSKNTNQTFSDLDNLSMGNIEVCSTTFSCAGMNCSFSFCPLGKGYHMITTVLVFFFLIPGIFCMQFYV